MAIRLLLVVLSIAVFSANLSHAGDDQYFKKGDIELGLNGSYNYISMKNDGDSQHVDFFYADLGVSYYVIDNFSLGVNTLWFYLPKVEGFEGFALGLEAVARYHYQATKSFIPYLGIHAAYCYADAEADGESSDDHLTTLGAHIGFKMPINEHVYFNTELKWTNYDLPWDSIELSSTQILLGLNIKL